MKILKILFIFLIFSTLLVGCGKDELSSVSSMQTDVQTENTEGNTQTTIERTTEATTEKPVEGGEFIISMRIPKTLNPLVNEDSTVDSVLKLIFEPLFTISEENLKPIPNLASGYTLSEDGKTLTINMRQGITWHDGNSITAEDVVFSLDTIKANPNSLYTSALDKVASYSSKGEQVIINYIEPYSFFAFNLCFPIIPKHYYKGNLDINSSQSFSPIGSGSFRFENYRLANELILTKTTNFKGTPYIDSIKVLITPNQDTDLYAFEKNVTNSIYIDFSTWGKINHTRKKNSNGALSNSFEYLGFNFEKEIFKNVELRKAIAYAIPKDEIIKNIYLSNGIKSLTPINPYSYFSGGAYIENYSYSIENAIEALGKSNVTQDISNLTLLVNEENKERLETAELIQKRLNQIGLNITIVKKSFEEYKASLEASDFDMFLGGIDFGLIPNLQSFLTSNGTGEGGINYQNFSDARMDSLVDNLYKALSEQEFISASITLQQYFSEQLPVVGILFKDKILITDYTVSGDKKPNMYSQYNGIEKWYIKD